MVRVACAAFSTHAAAERVELPTSGVPPEIAWLAGATVHLNLVRIAAEAVISLVDGPFLEAVTAHRVASGPVSQCHVESISVAALVFFVKHVHAITWITKYVREVLHML